MLAGFGILRKLLTLAAFDRVEAKAATTQATVMAAKPDEGHGPSDRVDTDRRAKKDN